MYFKCWPWPCAESILDTFHVLTHFIFTAILQVIFFIWREWRAPIKDLAKGYSSQNVVTE